MEEKDIEQFSDFLKYFQNESDRGAALIGASMVESRLHRIFELVLINNSSKNDVLNGPNSIIGTFSSKTKMCHVLGFITEKEYHELEMIRKIRNEFAHKLGDIKFSNKPIPDYCLNLKASTPLDYARDKNYRGLFINSVILVTLALWYRPEEIMKIVELKDRVWQNKI